MDMHTVGARIIERSHEYKRSQENRIIEQQGTVNNRPFVLLNFRSIIPALTVYLYINYIYMCVCSVHICIYIYININKYNMHT